MALALKKTSGSNAAETFGATNGGVAPGTKVLSLDAVAGKFLIPLQVRATITGTAQTNCIGRVRYVTAAGNNRDTPTDGVSGAAQQFQNTGAVRTEDGSLNTAVDWELDERNDGIGAYLTDADKITKIEVWMRRSNTTDAVVWAAQIVAVETG